MHVREIELEWLALLYLVLHPVRSRGDPELVDDLVIESQWVAIVELEED